MGFKVDNVVKMSVTRHELIMAWMQLLVPFHRLRPCETKLGVALIELRNELAKGGTSQDAIKGALFSDFSRQSICDKLGITRNAFKTMLSVLRKVGFVKDEDINPRFIPRCKEGSKSFSLLYHFDIKEDGGLETDNEGGD